MRRIPTLELPHPASNETAPDGTQKKYWRSLDEVADTPEFQTYLEQEFPSLALRNLPAFAYAGTNRRSLLKLMAGSLALATVSACTRQEHEPLQQYVNMEHYYSAGEARHYATVLTREGYGLGAVVETENRRPIKVEGNPLHPASLGATDIFAQAATLELYDPDRARAVSERGRLTTLAAFSNALLPVRQQLQQTQGEGCCIVTGNISSPTQLAQLRRLLQRYPRALWYVADPLGRQAAYEATEQVYGRRLETRFDLRQAELIVSLGGDFLDDMPGQLYYARQFSQARLPPFIQGQRRPRLYTLESSPTLTGAQADTRLAMSAGELQQAAAYLAQRIGLTAPGLSGAAPSERIQPQLEVLAQQLAKMPGRSLIVAGVHQPEPVQALAHAMNAHLDNIGRTLLLTEPVLNAGPARHSLPELSGRLREGRINKLFIFDTNVAYQSPPSLKLAEHIGRLPFSVYLGAYADETAACCRWHLPQLHAFESWSDARAFDGSAAVQQPMIAPMFDGITAHEILALLTGGESRSDYDIVREHWLLHFLRDAPPIQSWNEVLQDGILKNSRFEPLPVEVKPDWFRGLTFPAPVQAVGFELHLRPDPTVRDGRYANNTWLQELPKPLTKLTWDNAALISPAVAHRLALSAGDHVRLAAGGQALIAPVYLLPGQPDTVITISLGYGRPAAGSIGTDLGVNAYRLRDADTPWLLTGVAMQPVAGHTPLARTQHHHSMQGFDLIREIELSELAAETVQPDNDQPPPSLYDEVPPPDPPHAPYAWGMSIDLDACIGCSACVIACQAENNIPVVGKQEVLRGREMHWLRVDRYYKGDPGAPETVFQPVPCMHCELAPCEYVCPVIATSHSEEGLNEQTYNRCIGTRDCSQNCPYKVRRFNWFTYTRERVHAADYAFPHNQTVPPEIYNPEVTVRTQGVMEKCTYCVQRINKARIEARNLDLPIPDGSVMTACQQVCPTQAIVFGDISDATTLVARAKRSPRDYSLLQELGTRPRTTYLKRIVNERAQLRDEHKSGNTHKPGESRL